MKTLRKVGLTIIVIIVFMTGYFFMTNPQAEMPKIFTTIGGIK